MEKKLQEKFSRIQFNVSEMLREQGFSMDPGTEEDDDEEESIP